MNPNDNLSEKNRFSPLFHSLVVSVSVSCDPGPTDPLQNGQLKPQIVDEF